MDTVAEVPALSAVSEKNAAELGEKPSAAFASIKLLLRKPVAEAYENKEETAIREFVNIWYSDSTWENLKKITIR